MGGWHCPELRWDEGLERKGQELSVGHGGGQMLVTGTCQGDMRAVGRPAHRGAE